eukprot:2370917-Pyramimonas_sp.AAC.3
MGPLGWWECASVASADSHHLQPPASLSPLPCVESNPDFNHHLGCNCPSTATTPVHLQVEIDPITTTVELPLKLYCNLSPICISLYQCNLHSGSVLPPSHLIHCTTVPSL